MSPEAQRIAIAEACGYTNVKPWIVKNVKFQGDDQTCGIGGDFPAPTKTQPWIPDYLNDLNAMHEVEKTLSAEQARQYHNQMGRIQAVGAWLWHAAAAHRAEAFLKTLGLWKE